MKDKITLKDSGLAFIFAIVAALCASILLSAIITSVAAATGQTNEVVSTFDSIIYINMFLSEAIFLVAFFAVVLTRRKKNVVKTTRLTFKFDYKIFLGVILIGVITMFASINMTGLFNHVFSLISPIGPTSSLGITMDNFGEFLIVSLLLGAMPAICEELVFRGIIYNGLRDKFNIKWATTLSAVMFSLIHLSIYKTFYQVILGVVLALIAYYTGTIFYGIVFHFINNFTIVLVNYISPNSTIFEFSTWGVKEILISIAIFIVGVLAVVFFFAILKNYTRKHKNYFNLEKTDKALETLDENAALNQDDAGLSDYEKKLLKSEAKTEGLGVFLVGIIIAVILWSVCSFGGFIWWKRTLPCLMLNLFILLPLSFLF